MDPVILIFAGIAAFLIFKLLSALGENSGEADGSETGNELDALRRSLSGGLKKSEDKAGDDFMGQGKQGQPVEIENTPKPVRKISTAAKPLMEVDPNFDEQAFLDGAKAAYEMIVEAFAKGDINSVRRFLGDNVFQSFKSAVSQREQANQSAELQFVGIENAAITSTSISDDALLAVTDFTSNQVRVTRDADGTVVDGDPNRIDLVKDRWTFSRKRNSRDPNWVLVATGAVQ